MAKGCLFGCLGVVVIGVAIVFFVMHMLQGVTSSANSFLSLLAQNKVQEAYDSAAGMFRSAMTVDQLRQQAARTGLDHYKEASWTGQHIDNNTGDVSGSVTTREGSVIPVKMTFVYEKSAWRVSGVDVNSGSAGFTTSGSSPTLSPTPAFTLTATATATP